MELRSMMIAGIMLLGSAAAQQPAATKNQPATAPKTQQTPPTKLPEAPAAKTQGTSPFASQKEKASYALGMNVGTSIRENLTRQSVDVDYNVVLQGFKDSVTGGKTLLTEDEARAVLTQLQNEVRAQQEEKLKQAAEKNKKEGQAFLTANKSKEGVVTLPSGLQYKILTAGNGPKPKATDTVVCNYKGTFIDGTEFDNSAKHGGPSPIGVGRVIPGWTEALQIMPVGSKWQLFVPSELAYGQQGDPRRGMEPNRTLIFDVELVSIQAPPPTLTPSPAPAPPK